MTGHRGNGEGGRYPPVGRSAAASSGRRPLSGPHVLIAQCHDREYPSPDSYTAFVLHKENMDTTEALAKLGEILRLPPKRFYFAGTKDKRAVTSQDITVRGIPPMRLWHVNRALRRSQMALGNFREGIKEPLLLGQLGGEQPSNLCCPSASWHRLHPAFPRVVHESAQRGLPFARR